MKQMQHFSAHFLCQRISYSYFLSRIHQQSTINGVTWACLLYLRLVFRQDWNLSYDIHRNLWFLRSSVMYWDSFFSMLCFCFYVRGEARCLSSVMHGACLLEQQFEVLAATCKIIGVNQTVQHGDGTREVLLLRLLPRFHFVKRGRSSHQGGSTSEVKQYGDDR